MTNFTGSTSPTGCFSSWQWQFTSVWKAAHRRTFQTTAFRPPVSTLGGTCVPPTVNSTACSSSLPAQHLLPSGLFSCRPQSLELSSRFHPGPNYQCRLFRRLLLPIQRKSPIPVLISQYRCNNWLMQLITLLVDATNSVISSTVPNMYSSCPTSCVLCKSCYILSNVIYFLNLILCVFYWYFWHRILVIAIFLCCRLLF